MEFRKTEEADIQNIICLLNDCKPFVLAHHNYVYWILQRYYQSTTFVCTQTDDIIGFICGLPSVDQSTVFIWQICVHPDFRRKGIALKLIKLLFDTSVEFGFNNIQLSITTENSISKNIFKKFSNMNSLNMDLVGQSSISGKIEDIYIISEIEI